MLMASRLVCQGCGHVAQGLEFVCAHHGDGRDHVLMRELDESALEYGLEGDTTYAERPFLRWRHRLHAYHLALSLGWSDTDFIGLVSRLEDAVARLDRRFVVTPLLRADDIAALLAREAPLWVKDETRHVAGSHKARHLFPVLLALEVTSVAKSTPLAIASCGNAALAAAVLARAAERPLTVFVPPELDPFVATRLAELGADIRICPRDGQAGDPTVRAFSEAVSRGAIPFSCQGNLNGLAVEGGETLGWELAQQLADTGGVDRVFVQVGGGLLASALARGLEQAVRAGRLSRMPRIHAVQTTAVAPLARAYDKVVSELLPGELPPRERGREFGQALEKGATRLMGRLDEASLDALVVDLARRRSEFMWPWEHCGHSLAHGLLDDETYDWLALLKAMLLSGGYPLIVDEAEVIGANTLGVNTTSVPVDETGTTSLAGLLQLALWRILPPRESCLVLFTGRRRIS